MRYGAFLNKKEARDYVAVLERDLVTHNINSSNDEIDIKSLRGLVDTVLVDLWEGYDVFYNINEIEILGS